VDAAHPGKADEVVLVLPPEFGATMSRASATPHQNQALRK